MLFALYYWNWPFWVDFFLIALIVLTVILAPIVASMLGNLADGAVGVVTWIMSLLSVAHYGMKFLFEWVYIAALVITIALLATGFLLSLLGVVRALHQETSAWKIGWIGMIVSVAGIALALRGYGISDALALLPLG